MSIAPTTLMIVNSRGLLATSATPLTFSPLMHR